MCFQRNDKLQAGEGVRCRIDKWSRYWYCIEAHSVKSQGGWELWSTESGVFVLHQGPPPWPRYLRCTGLD
ncbi:hypothetical protein HYQ46_012978 [Verticillium longisporum]|nr:hypothetical protein HYQ46_012978 [Verticillium longisporum]